MSFMAIDLTEDESEDGSMVSDANTDTVLGKHKRNENNDNNEIEQPSAKKRKLNGTLDNFVNQIESSTNDKKRVSKSKSKSPRKQHQGSKSRSKSPSKRHKHESRHRQRSKSKSRSRSKSKKHKEERRHSSNGTADSERESSNNSETDSFDGSVVSNTKSKSISKSKNNNTFSIYSIKKLLKSDKKLNETQIAKDAALIIADATKLFICNVVTESVNRRDNTNENSNSNSNNSNSNDSRKLEYDDISETIGMNEKYSFLKDIVPQRVTLQEIMAQEQAKRRESALQSDMTQQRQQSLQTQNIEKTKQAIEIIDIVSDD